MRHGKKINHLGRTAAHRKAMLANMACSLIEHKRINTTVAKAKALKKYVEPLITKSKDDSTHSRRVVFSYLRNKYAVTELFREVAAKVADRPGGYTRIIKTGNRLGDNAEMCMMELVDFNELYTNQKESASKGKKRSRRGGGAKKAAPATTEAAVAEAPAAEPAKEVKEETPEAAAPEVAKEEAAPAETEAKAEETKEAPEAPAAEAKEANEEAKKEEGDKE